MQKCPDDRNQRESLIVLGEPVTLPYYLRNRCPREAPRGTVGTVGRPCYPAGAALSLRTSSVSSGTI